MNTEQVWKEKLLHPDLRAGGWIRLIAAFYDLAIIGMLLMVVGGISTLWLLIKTESPYIGDPAMTRQYMLENEFHLLLTNWILLGVSVILVQIVYSTIKKQTFGMMFVDIALCDENTGDITRMQYFKRECLKIILFPTFIMAFGKEKRTLYDKLSKCYLMR